MRVNTSLDCNRSDRANEQTYESYALPDRLLAPEPQGTTWDWARLTCQALLLPRTEHRCMLFLIKGSLWFQNLISVVGEPLRAMTARTRPDVHRYSRVTSHRSLKTTGCDSPAPKPLVPLSHKARGSHERATF